ncbi:Exodeoxyribonuclease 7 large subunit [Geodia barretti]|uniref:Exodeoxyribonuclease 7 large subunit n=1 Tax=Geodia barretti TaxID=519541 RepID=A0AA35TD72_GEOBA|nr:Exodeoxyribonuclease 7 large subunit [Geodia barretti]
MLSPVVYSVKDVAGYLKEKLESDNLLSNLTVQGEIANLRTVASGHSYFSLRGDGNSIRCVMFRGRAGQEYLESGQEVLVGGTFTFYGPSGEANLQVAAALPVGSGALALELVRLRQQLESEGLFDPSRKRPLPEFPGVIGVVTSPSGAVWQDIQNGERAAGQIAAAISRLNDEGAADVIIVARGGGSLEDLWCFNTEEVGRSIFASGIPVVSGIGHETDHTIADDVADRRAPTPSAAAELATPDRLQLLSNILGGLQQSESAMTNRIARLRNSCALTNQRLVRSAPDVGSRRRQVDDLADRSAATLLRRIDLKKREIATLGARLNTLDPAATLRRGFAVVNRYQNAAVVTDPGQVPPGDLLYITVAGGTLDAPPQHPNRSAHPRK